MTHELLSALRSGVTSTEYFRLLQNYGYWAHTAGCKGYGHSSCDLPTPVISDETALEIDRAVGVLKASHPKLFLLFELYFIKQRSFSEIMQFLKRKSGRKHYHNGCQYNPAVDDAMRYLNMRMIHQLLHKAESAVFVALKENQ
jgi:hypothetical protein